MLLDDVHKYPNWSGEIKLIYDNFPELKVIFTSSSMLEIYKSESDLSRRAVVYDLKELSFSEFIAFETKKEIPVYTFHDILERHKGIAAELLKEIKPLPLFEKYLKMGAYPYYKEEESLYMHRLQNSINLTVEIDIKAVEDLNYDILIKLKKLLITIPSSDPFTPNISKLSEKVGITRNSVVKSIKILERAGLVRGFYKDTSGTGALTNPEKLYLNNSNLINALAKEKTDIRNVQETLFLNQFKGLHEINRSDTSDFIVDQKYTFHIGGRNKTKKQIATLQHAYIAKGGIEIGFGNIIPVRLFGLMY